MMNPPASFARIPMRQYRGDFAYYERREPIMGTVHLEDILYSMPGVWTRTADAKNPEIYMDNSNQLKFSPSSCDVDHVSNFVNDVFSERPLPNGQVLLLGSRASHPGAVASILLPIV